MVVTPASALANRFFFLVRIYFCLDRLRRATASCIDDAPLINLQIA
jgi:hypothetical protein